MSKKIIILILVCTSLATVIIYKLHFAAPVTRQQAAVEVLQQVANYGNASESEHWPEHRINPTDHIITQPSISMNDLVNALYLNDKGKWSVRESGVLKSSNLSSELLDIFMTTAVGFDSCTNKSDCVGFPAAGSETYCYFGRCTGNIPINKKDFDKYSALRNYVLEKARRDSGFHCDPFGDYSVNCISEPVFACENNKCVLKQKGVEDWRSD